VASGKKETAFTFFSNVASAVLLIGTQSCLAWFLGPAGRGEYAICITLAMLLSVVFGLGVEMALVYYIGSKRFSLSEAVSAGLLWCLIGSLAAIVVGFAITNLPLAFVEKAPLGALYLSLLFVPIILFELIGSRALIGSGQIIMFGILSVIRSASVLVLTFTFVWFVQLGVHGAILALILGNVLEILVTFLSLARRNGLEIVRPSREVLKMVLGYGIRFYFGKLGRQLNFQFGTVILAFLATKSEVGLFAATMAIMSRVWMVPDTLNVVLLPRTSSKECGRPELVAKCCRLSIVCVFFILILLLLFARPLVVILLSRKFLAVVPLIWILTLGVLVRSHAKVLASYFNGLERPGLNSLAILSGLVTNAFLMPILFKFTGLPGAALAVTISYFVETYLVSYWFIKISGQCSSCLWRLERSDWADVTTAWQRFRRIVARKRAI
jgi:O-antigen/teichoic acid export membrane protein